MNFNGQSILYAENISFFFYTRCRTFSWWIFAANILLLSRELASTAAFKCFHFSNDKHQSTRVPKLLLKVSLASDSAFWLLSCALLPSSHAFEFFHARAKIYISPLHLQISNSLAIFSFSGWWNTVIVLKANKTKTAKEYNFHVKRKSGEKMIRV